jgi:hypothetical protein
MGYCKDNRQCGCRLYSVHSCAMIPDLFIYLCAPIVGFVAVMVYSSLSRGGRQKEDLSPHDRLGERRCLSAACVTVPAPTAIPAAVATAMPACPVKHTKPGEFLAEVHRLRATTEKVVERLKETTASLLITMSQSSELIARHRENMARRAEVRSL